MDRWSTMALEIALDARRDAGTGAPVSTEAPDKPTWVLNWPHGEIRKLTTLTRIHPSALRGSTVAVN